jgi:hypothetical protein
MTPVQAWRAWSCCGYGRQIHLIIDPAQMVLPADGRQSPRACNDERKPAQRTRRASAAPDTFHHPSAHARALALGLAVGSCYARPQDFPLGRAARDLGLGEARRPAAAWLSPDRRFAALAFLRLEPLTLFLNIVIVLALLAFWVRTFRTGRLLAFGWIDYAVALAWVPLEALLRPWQVLSAANRQALGDRGANSRVVAVLRGLVLALPILVVFAALLTAADLIFADYLRRALEWLDLERLADLARRTVVVLFCSVFFLGALVAALRDPGERKLIGADKPLLAPFLGFTESVVVLLAVDLLFALFVFIQFRYLFGGEANITASGFTYSEYARRGFGELVAVAFLTLALILGLGAYTRRGSRGQQGWFLGLSAGMVALVGMILTSAFLRLQLYEAAYGFSRLRAYTHAAILWMGVSFLLFLVTLLAGNLRAFAPAAVGTVLGFALTLNVLNVDDFIVRRNAERARAGSELDIVYLTGLSEDSVPALAALAGESPPEIQKELLPRLACHLASLDQRASQAWPSTHLSVLRARSALEPWREILSAYRVDSDGPRYGWTVEDPQGKTLGCFYPDFD